jgi:hypothetical protein
LPVAPGRRRGARSLRLLSFAWLAAAWALAAGVSAAEPGSDEGNHLRLTLLTPRDGDVLATPDAKALLVGQALAVRSESERFDLILGIDISQSAGAPAGSDVDGDGAIGEMRGGYRIFSGSNDPGDSVLAAQLLATRTLVSQLDPHTTRVGLVAFSGDEDPATRDAFVVLPLTSDFALVGRALDYLNGQIPRGRTHIAAAIDTAVEELLGSAEARSRPRPDATRVLLLMTDGQPTLPYPGDAEANGRWTLEAGRRAAAAGVRIDSFAIGSDANKEPNVLRSLSSVSAGRFTAVVQPAELVAHFEDLRITSIEGVVVHNRTTDKPAEHTLVEADGRFAALVELAEGENLLELVARDSSGAQSSRLVRLSLAREGRPPVLYPRWSQARTRMLESELGTLRERNLELQAERERELVQWMREQAELARERERQRGLAIRPEAAGGGSGAAPGRETPPAPAR